MKSSRYNLKVHRDDGTVLLYNTLHGSLTSLDPHDVSGVAAALESPDEADPELVDALIGQHHLVEEDLDELAILAKRRAAGISDTHRLDVIVMTTMDCNLDCIYCYESHERGTRMSAETEQRLTSFLEREIPTSVLTILQWFGGEPLLDTRLIARVTRRAQECADVHSTVLAPHVTTNGYLLDGWRRRELLDAGVRDFQITVDGPPDTHNRMRPMRSGRGSFERIFANITDTVRADTDVMMSLRVNVNHTNLGRISELLTMFDADVRPRLRLVLEPIFGDNTVAATANINPKELSAAIGTLYLEAKDLGYEMSAAEVGALTGRLTYCYAERDRQVVINHDGSVFKCTTTDFDPANRLGMLGPDGHIDVDGYKWGHWMSAGEQFSPSCQECVYLPLCMGGCRKMQFESVDGTCNLVPTNAHYVLKQIGLEGSLASLLTAHQ